MRTILLSALLFFLYQYGISQASLNERLKDQMSIMVLPHNPYNKDVLKQVETDEGYKEALLFISGALINMGYTKTGDIQTFLDNVKKWADVTNDSVYNDYVKQFIQQALADIIIDTEILWNDPVGNPQNRQVSLRLKAIDKYNGEIYATSISIRSAQRAYPDLKSAIEHVLKNDGATEFKKFLNQLDSSYMRVMREGRTINMKFEIDVKRGVKLNDRVGGERISDKIEQCIHDYTFNGNYQIKGEADSYMEVTARIPIVDSNGASVNPNVSLKKKIDDSLYAQGLRAELSTIGTWINFKLISMR